MKYIGIDTGVNTGIAVWDTKTRQFDSVDCVQIHRALDIVLSHIVQFSLDDVVVRIEDARQRHWIPDTHDIRREMGRRQGAGSVKRDSQIWEDFLKDHNIRYELIPPRCNRTKLDASQFKTFTGWTGRTNSHGRDAAMLVFGESDRKRSPLHRNEES